MSTLLRRSLGLAVIGGAVAAIWGWQRGRQSPSAAPAAPEWPPLTTVGGRSGAASTERGTVSTTISTPDRSTDTGDATSGTTGSASFVNALVDAPDARSADGSGDWVEPLADGTCPATHPIKANDNSGIYHVPGGRFYERTNAERCYATAEAAAADGYRAAKA